MARVSDSDGDVGTEFTEGDFTYVITSESEASDTSGTVRIKSYDGSISELTIPSTATDPGTGKSYNVASIGVMVFAWSETIVSVTIPASVTSIEDSAFKRCTNMASVRIQGTIKSIGEEAFMKCTSLISIAFQSSSVTIGNTAFSGCENLNTVTITGTGGTIGDSAFYDCSALGSISLPSSTSSIGDSAFQGCTALGSIDIPAGVRSIGKEAFQGCTSLQSASVQEGSKMTSIGEAAFNGCSVLGSIDLPDSLTAIGASAFSYCPKLDNVIIPDSVKTLENNVFEACFGLTTVKLPDDLETIKSAAFNVCSGLESIYLPDSVKTLQSQAFFGCTGLQSIRFGKEVTDIAEDAFGRGKGVQTAFYDEKKETTFNLKTDIGELQGRLFKADGSDTSKMIRQVQYKLTFDCGEGSAKEVMYNEGDRIAKPDDPEKTGYSFMRWEKDGEEFDFANATMPAEDMTLTAAWKVNRHTISFDPDGGSPVDPITQDYGTLVEKPADPTKDGYSFLYWAKDGKEYTFGTMPAEDIVLRAVWEAHAFTVTFVTGTGTEIAYERAYGSSMTIPGEGGEISKAGYSLSGWQISEQGDVYGPGTEYRVASDVTFTAVWEAVPSPAPAPSGDDDDEGKDSDSGSGTSVAAVAIAAGCAAVLLAMIRKGRSGS